ncbi:DNA repair protein REV1 [Hetaerina americana]|uniref:DNA repair protein REV1 n=1 Tax=Hetaerina americana TaxID=62018 RepID=UPI003A7F15CF
MSKRPVDAHVSYWTAKKAKLEEQLAEVGSSKNGNDKHTPLFHNVHIYVNGYTVPPAEELKNLITRHGGVYSLFLDSSVTHMVTNNLPDSKMKLLKKVLVVSPEWVTDSISKGKQLPTAGYLTVNPLRGQRTILPGKYIEESKQGTHLGRKEYDSTDVAPGKVADSTIPSVGKGETSVQGPSVGADVDAFYNKSRLHFLSTMKMEFKNYVNTLRKESNQHFPGLEKLKLWLQERKEENGSTQWQRSADQSVAAELSPKVVMHLDMDCFFASVSCCGRPNLEGVPIAVTSSKLQGPQSRNLDSMADVACCNYEARAAGVRNGMRVGTALQICPNLVAVPYEFEKYRMVSRKLYELASSYTVALEAVSCDEMYIDCTSILMEANCSPVDFAEHVRKEIKESTGCCASAGLGGNHILARLATRKAKPNGVFYVEPEMVEEFMKVIPLRDLPGIGPKLNSRLKELNIHTCGELKTWQLSKLENEFGPHTGKKLYNNCRGLESVTQKEGHEEERKSVSSEINYGIRFTEFVEAEETLRKISKVVSSKLGELKGKCITLKLKVRSPDAPLITAKFLGHGICDSICRASSLDNPVSDPDVIAKIAIDLLRKSSVLVNDLRGLGIMVTKLETGNQKQKTDSITHYFSNHKKSKGSSSPKAKTNYQDVQQKSTTHTDKPLVNAFRLLSSKNIKLDKTVSDHLCGHGPVFDNTVEEMDCIKLLRSHLDSFICSERMPDVQLENTALCILLNEISQLNIATALSSLKELNRLIETKIVDAEKQKRWTILLEKISRKVYKAISKGITFNDRDDLKIEVWHLSTTRGKTDGDDMIIESLTTRVMASLSFLLLHSLQQPSHSQAISKTEDPNLSGSSIHRSPSYMVFNKSGPSPAE